MAELLLVEAVNDALHVEMERDADVLVMGEDVSRLGGVFRATAGLRERFGADRCIDTPLAEAGILGTAVGLCMAGWRPVCEMQYDAFSYPALDQLINHVGRYRWRTRGTMEFPLTIRMPYGGGVRAPELHDDSPETYYVHTPGVKVAIPSTPADAKGLLAAAIRDPDPVVVLEPKLHYRTSKEDVPDGEHVVPLGKARIAREGSDLTLVAYGAMVPLAERAAEALEGEASCEVLDLRSLKPLDEESLLSSVARTGRVVVVQEAPRVCGFAAEVAAVLAEKAIFDLRGPVIRVTGYDVPYPYWQIEDAYMPSVERVVDAATARARRVDVGPARDPARAAHAPRPLLPRSRAGPDHRPWRLDRVRVPRLGLERRAGHEVRAARREARRRTRARRPSRGAGRPCGRDARGADRRGTHRRLGLHVRRRLAHAAQRAPRGRRRRHRHHQVDARRRRSHGRRRRRPSGRDPPVPRGHRHAARRPGRPLDRRRRDPVGGNIDCKELVAGTTLFLPIAVDGALLSAGDGHAAQGDGEISQLAIEAPVERARLTISVRDDLPLTTPIAWTPEAWLTFGFDEDLDEAAAIAIDALLELMGRELGLERREALAFASVVADLRVTQLVNGAKGVHAVLPHGAIRSTTMS